MFIGQGGGKGKEKGMTQKEQQATLAAFRSGEFNVMIATCIAEEGLDIPQVRSAADIHPVTVVRAHREGVLPGDRMRLANADPKQTVHYRSAC